MILNIQLSFKMHEKNILIACDKHLALTEENVWTEKLRKKLLFYFSSQIDQAIPCYEMFCLWLYVKYQATVKDIFHIFFIILHSIFSIIFESFFLHRAFRIAFWVINMIRVTVYEILLIKQAQIMWFFFYHLSWELGMGN